MKAAYPQKAKQAWKLQALLGVALLLPVMSACGKSGDPAKEQPGKTAQIENAPAEVVFYSNNGNSAESFDLSFGSALRKKFPHYTIKYIQATTGTTLPDMLASGQKFDIFFATIGNYERYVIEGGMEFDMRELIKKHQVDLNRLDPSYVDYMNRVSNGKITGFPIQNNVMVLYYNKTIFQRYGVPFPRNGMTWDEAIDLSKRLTRSEGGKQIVGLAVNAANTVNQNQFSLPSVDPSTLLPTINSNAQWKTIYDTLFARPTQDDGARSEAIRLKKIPDHTQFAKDQTLAMYGYSSGLISVWAEDLKKLDWDIVALPTFKEKPGIGAQPYPIEFGITSFSPSKDAAMQALKFLLSDEYQEESSRQGLMPVLTKSEIQKAFGKESPFSDKNFTALFHNKMAPIASKTPPYGAVVDKQYTNAALSLAQGTADINTLFRETEESALKEIKQLQQAAK
ncbi:MAG: extracellular solute-binding protein family 1 [Paenibacillus sp.]|nr:extracellular solute-binding protein family 1 [Paenibacillus sp.]